MKRLIAMRCTIEQFETLGIELSYKSNTDFIDYNYLCNDEDGDFFMSIKENDRYEYHETFNKDIFLEACGLLPKYEITKETAIKYNMKDEFPELFEKFTGWAKTNLEVNEKWLMYFEKGKIQYGFDANGDWHINESKIAIFEKCDAYSATTQEVKTALINEAVKRGFEAGYLYIEIEGRKHELESLKGNYQYLSGILFYQGAPIMNDGTWATIIPQKEMTIEEIEKELGYKVKIISVVNK